LNIKSISHLFAVNHQQCVSTPILVRGILMLILFNICLIAGVYFFYIYVNTLPTDERNKLNTAFGSVAAILVFISLLNLGVCCNYKLDILFIFIFLRTCRKGILTSTIFRSDYTYANCWHVAELKFNKGYT